LESVILATAKILMCLTRDTEHTNTTAEQRITNCAGNYSRNVLSFWLIFSSTQVDFIVLQFRAWQWKHTCMYLIQHSTDVQFACILHKDMHKRIDIPRSNLCVSKRSICCAHKWQYKLPCCDQI